MRSLVIWTAKPQRTQRDAEGVGERASLLRAVRSGGHPARCWKESREGPPLHGFQRFIYPLALAEWMQNDTTMKSLHIRDVPEQTIDRLKRRASKHHRSLQGELLALLEEAARQAVLDDSPEFTLHTVRTQGAQNWSREGIYED